MCSIDVDNNVLYTRITATPIMTVACRTLYFGKSPRYNISSVWLQLPYIFLKARLQNCEKRLLILSCLSVRLYIRMEQLGSHWTDFHEIHV